MPRRVLFLIDKYLDCSDTFIFEEMSHLRRYDSAVLALHHEHHPSFDGLRVVGADPTFSGLFPSRSEQPPACRPYGLFLNHFRGVLHQERPALLHAQFGNEALFFLPIRRWSRIPFVVSFRGSDASQWLPLLPERFAVLFREASLCLVRSDHMRKKLLAAGCPASRIAVHHSSIDLEKFPFRPRHPPRDGAYRILTVARLVEKKGLEHSLRAFARFLRRFPASGYTIVGGGELRHHLETEARRLRVHERVSFLGPSSATVVQRELQKSHIFLLTPQIASNGKQEGIPVAIMEALASGLPVVSTRHAGIPELVVHGESGLLAAEQDSDGIAAQLMSLGEQSAIGPCLAKKGRDIVEREFNILVQTARLERLYDELLQKAMLSGRRRNHDPRTTHHRHETPQ